QRGVFRRAVAWVCLAVVVFTSATATPRLAPFRALAAGHAPVTLAMLHDVGSPDQQNRNAARTGSSPCVLKAFVGVVPRNFGAIDRERVEAVRFFVPDHEGGQQCGAAPLLRPPRMQA